MPSRLSPAALSPAALSPADHHPPEQTQPGEDKTVLQPRGGEVTRRRYRDVHQGPGREDQRPPASQTRRQQPGGAQHHHRHPGHAQRQRQRQGDKLQSHRPGNHAGDVRQVGPRGGRVGLDPLAGIEHRPVARQQISYRAQHDQTVVRDPASLPRTPRPQRGHRRHGDPQADSRECGVGGYRPTPAAR